MNDKKDNAREFLEYAAANLGRLRRNLAKNVTFEPAIFDDVFHDSIIKVYENIRRSGKTVEDFERYFFISSKWNYINAHNAFRRRQEQTVREPFARRTEPAEEPEEPSPDPAETLAALEAEIDERFSPCDRRIFISYMALKCRGSVSYAKAAAETGFDEETVRRVVREVGAWVRAGRRKETELF